MIQDYPEVLPHKSNVICTCRLGKHNFGSYYVSHKVSLKAPTIEEAMQLASKKALKMVHKDIFNGDLQHEEDSTPLFEVIEPLLITNKPYLTHQMADN